MKNRTAFALPLWLAVAGGALEVAVLYGRKRANPLVHLSDDLVWMAPLALFTVTALVVAIGVAMARLRGPRPTQALAVFGGAAVVMFDLLLLVPRLAPPAAAVLAAGAAVQISRAALAREAAAWRLIRQSSLWLAMAVVLGGAGLWHSTRPVPAVAAFAGAGSTRPPNVVFITIDTVRAANLSVYGYARPTTPNLEHLATRGVVFDAAFSTASWTLPSHASMFTGRWPHELSVDYDAPLDATFPTLAEFLGSHGYATAGFAANLAYVGRGSGLARGFQHFEDYPRSPGQIASSSTLVRTVADNFRVRRLVENDEHLNRVEAEDLNTRALKWLDRHGEAPFLLFLNYFDAHEPYLPPPPFDRRFGPMRAHGKHSPLHHWLWNPAVGYSNMGDGERREEVDAYDGALASLDARLGEFLDALDHRGLTDNTVVVVTSDHGEEFGEHGVYDHGYSLYQFSLHVPLLIATPGRQVHGLRVTTPVTLRDLAATVSELAGFGGQAPFPGASLAGWWNDPAEGAPSAGSPVVFEVRPSPGQPDWFPSSKGDMTGAIVGPLHYIRNGDGREELYAWTTDPREAQDLAGQPAQQGVLTAARAQVARVHGVTGGTP